MRPVLPGAVLAGAVLCLTAVAGCSATARPAEPRGETPQAAGRATDASAGKKADATPGGCPTAASLPLPKDFPANLPVPDGAVVISVEHRTHDRLVLGTVVRGGFKATLTFLQQRLPKAGYALKQGEVDENDAESNFSSGTVDGRWTLRKMPGCEGGVYLTYLTSAAS
ncbi:hypothetical protein [Streptomyces sp. TP-A0356]|uniref:hypothetical protein n=1 Tax=Streptomyces sp. TP-A0356 TaxID=1359208 RepID=UPI0006E2288F|nr:hypothetical protein [Streptomyces sp. TP-A0356]